MFHVVFCILLSVINMLAVVDQLPRLGKRELICLLLFTCNYVVRVRRAFLFLWVLRMGCVILLWHSMNLPYIILVNSCFGLKGWSWVLIASVPDLCILFTPQKTFSFYSAMKEISLKIFLMIIRSTFLRHSVLILKGWSTNLST